VVEVVGVFADWVFVGVDEDFCSVVGGTAAVVEACGFAEDGVLLDDGCC